MGRLNLRGRVQNRVNQVRGSVQNVGNSTVKQAAQNIAASGKVAASKVKFLPLVPYVPAMNAFNKMRNKDWTFTPNVEETAEEFYRLYVKKDSFDYDQYAADNFEDKVMDSMNGSSLSELSGMDHMIPPELIQVIVTTVVGLVSATARKVKEGKATKQEAAIVAATEQAKEEFKKTAAEAQAESGGGSVENPIVKYLPYVLGLIVLGLISYAFLRKK